jgi:hypothetical protein
MSSLFCNGWSKEALRYMMCRIGRLGFGQEQGLRPIDKVLESPKQRPGTRRVRGNQSIEESIQEVV